MSGKVSYERTVALEEGLDNCLSDLTVATERIAALEAENARLRQVARNAWFLLDFHNLTVAPDDETGETECRTDCLPNCVACRWLTEHREFA